MAISRRLYRSRTDRVIAGVFGGLGTYFDIDPVVLRLAFIVFLVVTAFLPGALIYVFAIFIIPLEPMKAPAVSHQETTTTNTEASITPTHTPKDAPEETSPQKRADPLW